MTASSFKRHLDKFSRVSNHLALLQAEYSTSCVQTTPTIPGDSNSNDVASPQGNLITNNSFEEGSTPWILASGASVITTRSYTGQNSLELISSRSRNIEAHQTFTVVPAQNYNLDTWVYSDAYFPFTIYVRWYGVVASSRRSAKDSLLGVEIVSRETSSMPLLEWTKLSATLHPPPGAVSAMLSFYIPKTLSGRRVYFDEVVITPDNTGLPTPTPTSSVTAIPTSSPFPTGTSTPIGTISPNITASPTRTATRTRTATFTPTRTPTRTPTQNASSSSSSSSSVSSSVSSNSSSSSSNNGVLTLSLVATTNNCVAPCAVWFDASGTSHSQMSVRDVRLSLDYNFDYGDSNSGEWDRGALARNGTPQSKNIDSDSGVVGFHVYEQPGTYTTTLRVGNATTTTQVTVTNPNSSWPGTSTICFYTSNPAPVAGVTPGCPSGAALQQVTGINALSDAILNHCSNTGPKRCLFRRGETYGLADMVRIQTGSKYFGAYGTGAKPIWQDTATTANNNFIAFDDDLSDFHFVDLDVRGKSDVINRGSGVAFDATNTVVINRALWLRTDITRFNVALYMHCNNYPSCDLDNGDVHNQIAFVDSTAQYGPGATFDSDGHTILDLANIYITANYFAMAGSISGDDLAGYVPPTQAPMSGSSFNARFKWLNNAYVAHNEWGLLNPDQGDPLGVAHEVIGCGHELSETNRTVGVRGGAIFSFRNGLNIATRPDSLGNERDFPGENEIFVDNYVSACKYTQGSMGGFAQTDSSMEKTKERHIYSRMTGNLFTSHTSARQNATISLVGHGKVDGLLMSNNVFDGTKYVENNSSATAIVIYGADSQAYRCTGNINFSCAVDDAPSDIACAETPLPPNDPNYHPDYGVCEPNPLYHPPNDWRIYNNSFVVGPNNTTASHDFWRGTVDTGNRVTHATNLKFDNNLFYDADDSGELPTSFPGMTFCGGSLLPGNCNHKTSTNPWVGSVPFLIVDDFRLQNSSVPGNNIGLWKPEVPRDIFGRNRTIPGFAGAGGVTPAGP